MRHRTRDSQPSPQLVKRRALVWRPHEGLSDEHGVHACLGKPRHVVGRLHATFAHEHAVGANKRPQVDPLSDEWNRFYAVPRGHHPNASGGFTTTSMLSMLNFFALDYIKEISPRPILFIAGDRAHSKLFSERAYEMAAEPKELHLVEDAEHIDLYDRVDRIPFDKLERFFKDNLK